MIVAPSQEAGSHDVPRPQARSDPQPGFGVILYWLPMGVRGRWLHVAGKTFEAIAAALDRRTPLDLYHSVLGILVSEGRFVIEMGPVVDDGARRGVVAQGPVGFSWAAALRIFRYEVRCWREGITAFGYAVETRRLSDDVQVAQRVRDLVPKVPTPVWGRDDLGTGEMWTCNSLTSWLLGQTGLDDSIRPPSGGRAPGWNAGLAVARGRRPP